MNAYAATPPFNSDQKLHPVHNISDLTIEVYHQLEQCHNKAKQTPLLTGIPELDEKITGLRRGDLIVIAGKEEKYFSVSRIVNQHMPDGILHNCRIGIVSRQRMPICGKEKTLMLILQFQPVFQHAFVVPQMQATSRPHTGENPFQFVC